MRFTTSKILGVALALIILIACSTNLPAQTAATVAPQTNVARVTQAVNESNRVTLKGNTHPLANGKNETGIAPDSLPMERMLMVLKRSPDQQAALKTFMEGQQSKTSPNFHQWLTPEQFGQQYGVSDSDIQAVTSWLQTHGFTVNRVAAGKMLIEFSGTAGQVHEAFQTQIHKYTVKGQDHWANASDPTIPAALMPVITGINTLNNFGKKATIERRGAAIRTNISGGASAPLVLTGCPQNFGTGLSSNTNCFGVGPADFNAIYNVPALVGGVAPGTGQAIAIVGDSDICTGTPLPAGCTADDILNFRTLFGLPIGGPTNAPQIIHDGAAPGIKGDELEGDLDVEYAGAIAPNAQILFVVAADTETSQGIDLAAEHIVDANLAPVLNESFGACEVFLLTGGNAFYSALWEQAAAQGITVVISTGDTGSAVCDNQSDVASDGLTVSGIASTPFNVAAGGTDFDFTAAGYPQNFWNTTSGANFRTAKGYVPETTWNESCAQSGVTGCNAANVNSSAPPLGLAGGSGGQSNCSFSEIFFDIFGDEEIQCDNGYPKPSWQMGSGVPNDTVRDIPDISLFSALGLLSGSFYVVCESDLGGACVNGGSGFSFIPVGGTSAAAPTFSAIMALVNQNMLASGKSGRQGNANFVLYPMSAGQSESTCNSSLSPASTCVFNDVVKGNNSQPCLPATFNCSNTNPNSSVIGVLETVDGSGNPTGTLGFNATSGYDLATGLGSVNVTNLVNGWPAAAGVFTSTVTSLTMATLSTCPGTTPPGITSCLSIVHGTSVTSSITVTAGGSGTGITGDATLIGTCQASNPNCFGGSSQPVGVNRFDANSGNADIFRLSNGSVSGAPTKELVGGTYNVTAHYAGDGIHGASDSTTPTQVTVSPEGSIAAVSIFASGTSSAPYGSGVTIRTDINGSASNLESATGQVTLNDTFAGWTPVVLSLNSDGHVEYNAPNANFPGNNNLALTVAALGTGTHNFSAAYAGDASYNASTSAGVPFTVTQGATASAITASPASVPANTNFTLTATVFTQSFGNAPTGTVSFFAGSTLLGTAPAVGIPVTGNGNTGASFAGALATLTTAKITANSQITATYSGDTNYTASPASAAVSVAVGASPSFTLASATNPTFVAGNSGTSVITVAPTLSFAGTVSLTCSVTPTNLTSTPTCSFSAPSIVLGAAQTSTLTVATTATTSASAYTVTVSGTSGTTVVTTPVTVTVTAPLVPSFTLSASTNSIGVGAAVPQTVTFTVAPTNGFTGTVALTCVVGATSPVAATAPTCSMSPSSIALGASQTTTLSVTVTSTVAAGTLFSVTVKGTSGSTVVTNGVSFVVVGIYTLTPTASSFSASAPGQSGTVGITTTATSGFPFAVTLSVPGVSGPSQTSPPACSFNGVFLPVTTATLTQATPTTTLTLTCTTTAASAVFNPSSKPSSPRWLIPGSAAAATLAFTMFVLWIPSIRKRRGLVFAGLVIFIAGAICTGCGGGATPPVNGGTQPGSYTITVVGLGGTTQQTVTVTFVLQ